MHPVHQGGMLRALAVTTATRSPALPDVPSLGDFLPGYDASTWLGIGAPENTPSDIVEKLNKEINAVLADPTMETRFANFGYTAFASSSAEFGKFIAGDIEKWAKVVSSRRTFPKLRSAKMSAHSTSRQVPLA